MTSSGTGQPWDVFRAESRRDRARELSQTIETDVGTTARIVGAEQARSGERRKDNGGCCSFDVVNMFVQRFGYARIVSMHVNFGKLKLFYVAVLAVVFGRLVIVDCLMRNQHLVRTTVTGYTKVILSPPTLDNCSYLDQRCDANRKNCHDLDYCMHDEGDRSDVDRKEDCHPHDIRQFGNAQKGNTVFVPTVRWENVQEKQQSSIPLAKTSQGSGQRYDVKGVERINLLIDHGTHAVRGLEPMSSKNTKGFVQLAATDEVHGPQRIPEPSPDGTADPAPIPQVPSVRAAPRSAVLRRAGGAERAERRADADVDEEEEEVRGSLAYVEPKQSGAYISLGDLLRLAQPRRAALLGGEGHVREGVRLDGSVLHVHVTYSNERSFDPFARAPVRYTISAEVLPMGYARSSARGVNETHRMVYEDRGILVVSDVRGRVASFSGHQALLWIGTVWAVWTLVNLLVEKAVVPHFLHRAVDPHRKGMDDASSVELADWPRPQEQREAV